MEEVLLQEFNLSKDIPKNQNQSQNSYEISNNIPIQQNFNQNQNQNININPERSNEINAKIIQHQSQSKEDIEKVRKTMTDSLNMHIKEEEFLQITLDSYSQMLKGLVEDSERMEKNITLISDRNKEMKNQILEYRRKINMERDNLVRASKKLYEQTNEVINTKGKKNFN